MSDPRVIHGDCLSVLPALPDASVDAVVTDPPAGIAFMGKEWDDFRRARNEADAGRDDVFGRTSRTGPEYGRRERTAFIDFLTAALSECLRVAKPGARMLCWAIPRTSHWTGTAIEDAGWVIEDRIAHLFGQGFPKAKSRLKPACEDWWLARKPSRGVPPLNIDACRIPSAEGVIETRTGVAFRTGKFCGDVGRGEPTGNAGQPWAGSAAGRWPANVTLDEEAAEALDAYTADLSKAGNVNPSAARPETRGYEGGWGERPVYSYADFGGASRFFKICESDCNSEVFRSAEAIINACLQNTANTVGASSGPSSQAAVSALSGAVTWASQGASRLSDVRGLSTTVTPGELRRLCAGVIELTRNFVSAFSLVPQPERLTPSASPVSCAGIHEPTGTTMTMTSHLKSSGGVVAVTLEATSSNTEAGGADSASRLIYCPKASKADRGDGNKHPTVKNTELMRWLCRLITPPGGTVLDPFTGSGSTGKAAALEGFGFIGIEQDAEHVAVAEKRIAQAQAERSELLIPA